MLDNTNILVSSWVRCGICLRQSIAVRRKRESKLENRLTCEELYTLYLVFTDWALYKTPRIIEFCLSRDVGLGYLLFVLRSQDLHMNGGPSLVNTRARKNDKDEPEARHTRGRLLHQRHMGLLRSSCRFVVESHSGCALANLICGGERCPGASEYGRRVSWVLLLNTLSLSSTTWRTQVSTIFPPLLRIY